MKHGVLAVDPGKVSGVVFMQWSGEKTDLPVIQYSMESLEEYYAYHVLGALKHWHLYEKFTVACERFTITAQTVRNSQAPFSLEQIGVLKHLCREHKFPVDEIRFQAPVDAKNMFPNPALKKLGIWHRGGEGHANDAIRHALLALAKQGWVPSGLLQ